MSGQIAFDAVKFMVISIWKSPDVDNPICILAVLN